VGAADTVSEILELSFDVPRLHSGESRRVQGGAALPLRAVTETADLEQVFAVNTNIGIHWIHLSYGLLHTR
jgi:hypothetical protein